MRPPPIRLVRCASSRLALAYPVAAHDLELRIEAEVPPAALAELLTALIPAVLQANPRCRRVVAAIGIDDTDTLAAVEAAGLRPVVEIDLPEGEFTLAVAEPKWVTAADPDLDRVPGT